jgi:hypothetical protein
MGDLYIKFFKLNKWYIWLITWLKLNKNDKVWPFKIFIQTYFNIPNP